MKILLINWQDIKNPLGGGAEVHYHEIFRRIAAMGHHVTVFASSYPNAPEEEIIDEIKVIRKGSRSLFNYRVRGMYNKRFRYDNYDIIIDDINKIPFYTPLFVKGPLLAISHHFFGKSIFRETNFLTGLYVLLGEKFVDWVYKKTPFAVVSQSTLDEFIERGFNPMLFSIVPNAITQENFPMNISEKFPEPTVAYFGRLKKYKSVDHLLRAFALLKKQIGNARLIILGRGDFQHNLERLARDLKIEDSTKFYGFVSEEDKVKLLSQSWCMVNTSIKEGWGITNIEANACGCPVFSANSPGLRDSVKDGESGGLYEYGNIEQLSGMLIEILNNSERRRYLSEGAVRWAKTFSWDESARLMIKKCEKVIENYKLIIND